MKCIRIILVATVLLAGCSKQAENGGRRQQQAPTVGVAPVAVTRFIDRIDAVGTARANEQVTISAPVTERIQRLHFDDGDYVTRGQVIAVLAQGQETAQLAEADARQREAGQQLTRLNALKARGFATNSAVDTQVALASQAAAQAAQARAAIGDRVVRAPFSGWVSLRNISEGAVVSAGTAIAQISDISRIKLDFAVPETLLPQVRVAMPIDATAAAYPEQPFRGTVATIDPVLSPDTRAATIRAVLPNGDRRLKPGMLLNVRIESAARTAPSVPELAVVGDGNQSFVFTLDGDKVRRIPVNTGTRQDGRVEILSGLRPGQRVVTEGVVKITDGQTVKVAGQANRGPAAGKGKATRS
ncbi:efflux RND transporter periplasmic adaptor subunit [Sphingomonas sp.]|uniref:efflux RND transporter periplasmic adaptor subunit n=1 Tax=Sphingomonas sp. TaxID=28214 RepID=UPI002BAD68FD|nr:efflux RND transporter periplasmic adaptor subunit [Sphingomonas sp.]HWK36249.1 efflux RND transporter periplasmic adaptor subunit [Sphingomonas sp.]